uniref:Uncharacterized protein LOC104239255 n=1 Tax=Nicotiana sylvestris TaxID=4096 RepID=A0A1U7Y050_NICSY|nr:PREDICTED: uncharacterized protein LOC104239255 [Nicotiana sylvestris]
MEYRMWMYDKNLPNRRSLRNEFVQGVDEFINHAKSFSQNKEMIRYPYAKCKCRKWLKLEDYKVLGHPPPCKMRTLRRCSEQFNSFLGIVRKHEEKNRDSLRNDIESLKAQVNHLIGLPRSPPKSHI